MSLNLKSLATKLFAVRLNTTTSGDPGVIPALSAKIKLAAFDGFTNVQDVSAATLKAKGFVQADNGTFVKSAGNLRQTVRLNDQSVELSTRALVGLEGIAIEKITSDGNGISNTVNWGSRF